MLNFIIITTLFSIFYLILTILHEKYAKYTTSSILIFFVVNIFGWFVFGCAYPIDKYTIKKEYLKKDFKIYKIPNQIVLEFKNLNNVTIDVEDNNLDTTNIKLVKEYKYNMYKNLIDSTFNIEKK